MLKRFKPQFDQRRNICPINLVRHFCTNRAFSHRDLATRRKLRYAARDASSWLHGRRSPLEDQEHARSRSCSH
ncbi:hypothetical protein BMJ34_10525 [Sinorhizobium medicae]|uniref:Uncharacterized protein n=1 Tax=Sinorhizobium medicae TaxID=110321 RepID=A0ABX4TJJ1_9HYPH|nr:hypothetical protein BMJ35_31425 [Sinorhizobium medicae]PLU01494.1 hypothetical protein BMJ33_19065 [Sinorhizobium medicae]PLU02408.1 hypothetical protein BMJ34_10525 [Sinorhizobium medicae]PLU11826.1 hypothetical protein BMJ30_28805 [Sinorhizobium medicae]PLU16341.1 hypothetical protein BMJ31_23540 [Sinorhizobium medicae]